MDELREAAGDLTPVRYVRGSIADPAGHDRFVDDAVTAWGRLDLLVNNAGVTPSVRTDLLAAGTESFDRVLHDQDTTYGAPRITAGLNDGAPASERVNHKRVPGSCTSTASSATGFLARSAPRSLSLSTRRCPTCSSGTSPLRPPASAMSGTSPTYLPLAGGADLYLVTVIDCCSRRLVFCGPHAHRARPGGSDRRRQDARQPHRCDLPLRPRVGPYGQGLRPTTPDSAATWERPGPWARSGPAPTTASPRRSTPP